MSDWHPIDTAPRDGTRILLKTRMGVVTAKWDPKGEWWAPYIDDWTKAFEYEDGGFQDYLILQPVTHWMLIP